MKQGYLADLVRLIILLFSLTGLPVWGQMMRMDSVATNVGQPPTEAIKQLKAFGQRIRSDEQADSLLRASRKLGYLPGQVVALSYLATFRIQQQQMQQATALAQQAEELAGQLRNIHETGWAMSQIGRILHSRDAQGNAMLVSTIMPVMGSLQESMSKGKVFYKEYIPPGAAPNNVVVNGKRVPDRPAIPATTFENIPTIPIPSTEFEPYLRRHGHGRPDYVERLLDTLLYTRGNNPRLVRQLTEQKKIRDSSKALSKAFAKEGDYAKAYQYYLQYTAYKDSLNAEATTRRLALLEYKQNLLRKEAQINLLKKDQQLRDKEARRQQQFVLVLIGCVALLIAVSLLVIRNNRAKQLANKQLSEQKEALQETLVELKTTQTQLIHAEKMASLGELTAGIAHEIQNPLNFVKNFSEVSTELVAELIESRQQLQRDDELESEILDDVQQNLQKISQHGNRAASIVKGMLEHARPNKGQKERTDLNALADEYLKLAYHGMRAKDNTFQVTMTTQFAADLPPVVVSSQEIGRVLLNIFNNAFYAVQKRQQTNTTEYHPEVIVQTSREADRIKITIRDNGIGIPEAIRQKIFQPFFTTKPTGEGTGLGLSLSYDIITKGHGGSFTMESEEGKFTEMVITLPIMA